MDSFHPDRVYSSIDRMGRYAYGNQPRIALWNLEGLANTLLPVIAADPEDAIEPATRVLETFAERYLAFYREGMRRKLGLAEAHDGDDELAQDLLKRMADNEADFTLTFRRLSELGESASEADEPLRELFADPASIDAWLIRWRERLGGEERSPAERRDAMRSANPAFIPRNHRIEEVIQAAVGEGDFGPFEKLLEVLATPFEDQASNERSAAPPRPEEIVRETFCGT